MQLRGLGYNMTEGGQYMKKKKEKKHDALTKTRNIGDRTSILFLCLLFLILKKL